MTQPRKKTKLSPQLKAIKSTDLTPMIRISGFMAPRVIDGFLPCLDSKQKKAFDKVMPIGGGRKFYVHIKGTPTPPIVIGMSQPIQLDTWSEKKVRQNQLKGLTLTIEDVQAFQEKHYGKALWRMRGQLGTMMSMGGMFFPFLLLGPKELIDLKNKAMKHFKPMIDMMPRW